MDKLKCISAYRTILDQVLISQFSAKTTGFGQLGFSKLEFLNVILNLGTGFITDDDLVDVHEVLDDDLVDVHQVLEAWDFPMSNLFLLLRCRMLEA